MKNLISRLTVAIAGLVSLLMFTWPLLIPASATNQAHLAQGIFIALMPVILVLVLVEFSSGSIGSKQLAVLGVLIALNAVVRVLGAGTSGIETAFFLVIIGAFVFGSGFGFVLGSASLLVSALLTGGIGPWLPFQMMAAGLVGLGAGTLPNWQNKWLRLTALSLYAIVASFAYGSLMTMWNWPFLAGSSGGLGYLAGAPLADNLARFFQYELVSGGFIWDAGRAITTTVLIWLTAPALLATLKRAAGRAGFEKI